MHIDHDFTAEEIVSVIMNKEDNNWTKAETTAIIKREFVKATYYSKAELCLDNVMKYWHVYDNLSDLRKRFKCTKGMHNVEKMLKKIRRYYKGVDSIMANNGNIIIGGDNK